MSPERPASDPIHILVIQLSTLGDTLQSLMALRAAKQLYPNLEISVAVREENAECVQRVPWVAAVFPLDVKSIVGPVLVGDKPPLLIIPELADWMKPLASRRWDMIANWSFTASSSFLTALLPGVTKLGYSRRPDIDYLAADGWSHYIQAIIHGGVRQNIHLTDILTTQLLTALQINYGEPAGNGNEPVTSKGFFDLELSDDERILDRRYSARKWVGIQLGSGEAQKVWDPELWAEVILKILKRHTDYNVVLLGDERDLERYQKLNEVLDAAFNEEGGSQERSRVVSLVDKTDFDLWASVVSRCNWILATDTAVIHLASVHGTRVLELSVGSDRWSEAGPYGNGHYVIDAETLSSELVYGTWSYASSEWSHQRQKSLREHFSQLGWTRSMGGAQIYRSRIRPTNEGGGVVYEAQVDQKLELKDWISLVMGQVARAWYCGWVSPVGQELSREQIGIDLIQNLRSLRESCRELIRLCEEAEKTALKLSEKSAHLKSERIMNLEDKRTISRLGTKLSEFDHLIEKLGQKKDSFRGFAQMAKVMMHSLQGDGLKELGRESADSYRRLSEGLELLRQWLDYTIDLAKPVPVKNSKVVSLENHRNKRDEEIQT